MQYFVTIYIDTMKPKLDYIPFSIPHAFLGLTHTHPDELDRLGDIEIEKYDIARYDSFSGSYYNPIKKDKGKWYEQIYPSILDSNFKGEGFFGFGPITHASNHWGKVYENNQYAPESNDVINEYTEAYYYKKRPLSTFWQQNRCVFQVSKEQYEALLESIKHEVEKTKNRTPRLKQDDSYLKDVEALKDNLYYNSTPIKSSLIYPIPPLHNCVTWVLHKLDSIGIEAINTKEWLPDIIPNQHPHHIMTKLALKQAFDIEFNLINTLKDSFQDLAYYHFVFRKFQIIDKDLESIEGAKAFREWARGMIGNRFVCKIEQNYNRLSRHDITCLSEEEGLVATYGMGGGGILRRRGRNMERL